MSQHYRFGELDLLAVTDGVLQIPVEAVSGIPPETAASLAGADAEGRLSISVNNFVFRRGDATVLIDAGAGDTMQPGVGKLPANLVAAGVAPDTITHILITHLHRDHANGLVGPDGAAVFPAAELLVAAQEFDFWTAPESARDSDAVRTGRACNRVNLAPYRDRTRRLRDGEAVLGCTPILAPGHTPGHTCWRIDTGGVPLLAWGDIVHLAGLQTAHPEAVLQYDYDQEVAKRTRARILDMAASQGLVIAGAHVDPPGLGRVVRNGQSYAFEPV